MTPPESTAACTGQPLVSIGMPVYNGERYVNEALRSLLAQDYPNLEIIVSDNASTDQTAHICQEHARHDYRVRYHRAEQNRGASWNFNRVFELSRGQYFMWAGHDDLWAPECVGRCVERLEADPEAILCHSSSQPISMSDDRPIGAPYLGDSFVNEATTVRGRWSAAVRKNSLHAAIYGVIRRSALEKTRRFGITIGADAVLTAELSLQGKIIGLPEPLSWKRVPNDLAEYRTHKEMLAYLGCSKSRQQWLPQLAIVREMNCGLSHAVLTPDLRRRLTRDAYWIYASDKLLIADLKYFLINWIGPARYRQWSRFFRPARLPTPWH